MRLCDRFADCWLTAMPLASLILFRPAATVSIVATDRLHCTALHSRRAHISPRPCLQVRLLLALVRRL